jgi:alginate O-acetyltransferase complex protein AlgI
MLFSSIPFLFYFLPIVLIIYFAVPWKLKNSVLLLSSLIFYGWGEPKYVFLMIASILLFYGCGLAIEKAKKKPWKKFWLGTSIVVSVALLCVFKYADFFITNFNAVTGLNMTLLKLALPIGISFYTFQCLSYTIDVYRGNVEAQKNPINFGAYVALFPQLIAGPIVRYIDIAKELNHRTHSMEKFTEGLRRFIIGLAKKILIANQLGELTNIFRASDEKSVVFFWVYAIAFALHIYFDFSGYSDMAIGLGKIFGFNFIENFNYPYVSKSIGEFWRRWHMSLGSWFRDYIYIPLGGNRVSKGRWLFNTLVVWMLTGFWHGAAWNFILWGLLYALFLLIEKWVPAIKKLPTALKHAYTLLIVVLGFVLFNAVDIAQAGGDIAGMFGFGGVPFINSETIYYTLSYGLLFIISLIGATPFVRNVAVKLSTHQKTKTIVAIAEPIVLLLLLIVCSAYLIDGSFNPFLYFRF